MNTTPETPQEPTTPEKLSRKQMDLLQYLTNQMVERPYPPTVRELAEHFQVNPSTMSERLDVLVTRGFLYRDPRISRGIWVTEKIETLGLDLEEAPK